MRALRGVFVLVLALVLAACAPAGDLETGAEAYDRGDYATALKELRPLAEQGNAEAQVETVKSFDGKWSGQANLVKQMMANTMGPACASRLKLDLQISGSTVTGFVKAMPAWLNGVLSGVIDASGNLEGRGFAGYPLKLHGSLSADTGAGSGVWSTTHCEGTFELARVE